VTTAAPASEPVLRIRGLVKKFPGVQALRSLDLDVYRGTVHAIVGENGAGKSTLMNIIAGVTNADSGALEFDGIDISTLTEQKAGALGIGMVHQERSLVPELSVAENVFAGRQPITPLGTVRWRTMARDTRSIVDLLARDIDPKARVASLSPAEQHMVEIAKALSFDLRLLILDEPTAALTPTETERLFAVVRSLRAKGISTLYITHRLNEVFELADHVTVLRDGAVTGSMNVADCTEDELIRRMVGRALTFERRNVPAAKPAREVLRVTQLRSEPRVKSASLSVHAGEIVCIAGLIGAGRTELCEALFGVRRRDSGEVILDGAPLTGRNPSDSVRRGVAMVPEDRKEAGLFLGMDVTSNVVAASLGSATRMGVVARNLSDEVASRYVSSMRIRTPNLRQILGNLSGGNQQKVLLAKWLATKPKLLIVDEPTRGVDVGAREEIYAELRALAGQGLALLVVSSDLTEVLALAHRIVVMREGRVVGEIAGDAATEEEVVRLAATG